MKILSIGNSFSVNAHNYIHRIARRDGNQPILAWNLYIGGCDLARHFRNYHTDDEAYVLGVNGIQSGLKISIKKALLAMDWDYVTLQQASPRSFSYSTYQPYISVLADAIRELCPKAKILIHQTWEYEEGSEKLAKVGFERADDMFREIAGCYDKAAKEIDAVGIIPAGYTMHAMIKKGLSVHKDTFHANSLGEFAIALTWYQVLTARSVKNIDFSHFDFDAETSPEEIELAKRLSYEAVTKYGHKVNVAL